MTLSKFSGLDGVAFSPDDRRLVTSEEKREGIVLWDLGTGRELLRLDGQNHSGILRFSDDGEILLALSSYHASAPKFWRAPSWETIEALESSNGRW